MMADFEQRWALAESFLKDRFQKVPDMEGILYLIGINELGRLPERKRFSKEQKQDLMHVAVCRLLSLRGIFEFEGRDKDGWPHFRQVEALPVHGLEQQEQLLRQCVLEYLGF